MTTMQQLNKIFCTVFDNDEIEIHEAMTADDVDGWDSLSHVNLIVAIENFYKIKFTQKELLTFRNVGELYRSIEGKGANS